MVNFDKDTFDKLFQNDLSSSINYLRELLKGNDNLEKFYNDVLYNSANLNDLEKAFNNSLITFADYTVSKSRIRQSLLSIATELKNYLWEVKQNGNWTKIAPILNTISVESQINYVAILGDVASGKTTLLAHVAKGLSSRKNYALFYKSDTYDKHYLDNLLESVKTEKLPMATGVDKIFEVTMSIQNLDTKQKIPVTFLDVSGEDFGNEFIFSSFAKQSKGKFHLLLVLSADTSNYSKVREQDYIFNQLIQQLKNNSDITPIIVLTKWDIVKEQINAKSFLEQNYPLTNTLINYFKIKIFTSSVLSLSNDNLISHLLSLFESQVETRNDFWEFLKKLRSKS